jgi:TonB family protein
MNGSVTGVFTRIKRLTTLLATVGLFLSAADIHAQNKEGASVSSQDAKADKTQASRSQTQGVEILSDTQGVDFGPYIKNALATIKKNWLPLIPEEARPPGNVQGETSIRFTISSDGKIIAMHMDESSHNVNIDRAAWGAITGVGQFPPLPAEFKGQHIEVRIDFLTNRPVPVPAPLKP